MRRIMISGLHILHVEDEPLLRQSVAGVLGVYNLLISAASLDEAKAELSKRPFDLILLDKSLPDGHAAELIPLILHASPEAAVVLVTGDNDYLSVTNCLKLGAHDYIFKSTRLIQDLLMRIPVVLARLKATSYASQISADSCKLPDSLSEVTPEGFRTFKNNAEREYLCRALELADGDITRTGEAVGLARSTLFKKLAELGIARLKKYAPEEMLHGDLQ